MNYDILIWDFNGTILDDMELGMQSANELLQRYHLKELPSMEYYRSIFTFPVKIYYERIGLPPQGVSYDQVAHEWMAIYRSHEKELGVRAGALPVIEHLHKRGLPQAILSATEQNQLKEQVEGLHILDFFEVLLGRENIYASDKRDIAVRYREEHPKDRILMIGDTIHDYETACAGHFDAVLITGGHQTKEQLLSCGCPVIDSFEDLYSILGCE